MCKPNIYDILLIHPGEILYDYVPGAVLNVYLKIVQNTDYYLDTGDHTHLGCISKM